MLKIKGYSLSPRLIATRQINRDSRGEFTGAHTPAVPHWSQMPYFRDVAACVRAACPSHLARQSPATTIGFLPRTSMRGALIYRRRVCGVGLVNFMSSPEHSRYWHRQEIPTDRLRSVRVPNSWHVSGRSRVAV